MRARHRGGRTASGAGPFSKRMAYGILPVIARDLAELIQDVALLRAVIDRLHVLPLRLSTPEAILLWPMGRLRLHRQWRDDISPGNILDGARHVLEKWQITLLSCYPACACSFPDGYIGTVMVPMLLGAGHEVFVSSIPLPALVPLPSVPRSMRVCRARSVNRVPKKSSRGRGAGWPASGSR